MAVAFQTPLPSAASRHEEDLLWARRTVGDARARARLIERYVRLASMLARRYARTSEPLEDLEQVACVGLVRAVDRFDPGRGSSFATFAIPTILGELRRHFRDHTWTIRVPRELRDAWIAVDRTREVLSAELGRSPSPAEVARATGLSMERVVAGIFLDQLATTVLSARDREVLRLRVEEDMLQREIAERVGVSQMQVSRILRDSLTRLRHAGQAERATIQ